jgi:tyrosine-protein kinase Etk/Wzc
MRDHEILRSELRVEDHLSKTALFKPISLQEHLSVVLRHRVLFIIVVLSVVVGGAFYSFSKKLFYEGYSLIEVVDLRSFEQRNVLGTPVATPEKRTATSEAEIIRSRAVLLPVVEKLQLDIVVTPKYSGALFFDVRRALLDPFMAKDQLARSASDKPEVVFSQYDIPAGLVGLPITLKKISNFQYRLQSSAANLNTIGFFGRMLVVSTRFGELRVKIREISGVPTAEFEVQKIPRLLAVESLRSSLLVSELGKDSGIVRITYTDTDPKLVRLVLNEIGVSYLSFIRAQKTSDAHRSLELLQAQMPSLMDRVEEARTSYTEYRVAQKTSDLGEETRSRLSRFALDRARLSELREKRADLGTRVGEQHPMLIAVNQQIATVERQLAAMSSELSRAPVIANELDRRSRVLQSQTDMLNAVLRKIDELSLTVADDSSNVKIIDGAEEPIVPKGSRITMFLFFVVLGILLGVFAVFIHSFFRYKMTR